MLRAITVTTEDALEVVRLFHAEYDRAMRQDLALGLLLIAGSFQTTGADRDSVLLRVGAQMCGMIREDVYLDTFAGKTRLLASAKDAALLPSLAGSNDDIARYVVGRWRDAAGRVWYRIGNHTRAISAARDALQLIEREPVLWWCWGDIKSNLLRMQQEADTQVHRNPTVRESHYDKAIDCVQHFFAKEQPTASREQKIEYLRGLWNLHHNRMVMRGADALERSLSEFNAIRGALVELVGSDEPVDPYREAQTLNQEALQVKIEAIRSHDRLLLERSIACYRRLSQMPWPRGRFFARQHLPHLLAEVDSNRRSQSVADILALCKEVQSEQSGPGGREGFDLDRYYWTVDTATRIVGPEQPALREHDLGVARAIQAIASVSAYKNAAQRFVLPSLQRELERCIPQADSSADHRAQLANLDKAVALIEEGSARELLDLMSTRRESATGARPEDVFVPVDGLDPSKGTETGGADATAGGRNRRAAGTPDQRKKITEAVGQQRNREEEHWLGNPLPTQGVDPEISHFCRQFSAERFVEERGGPLLIRFFQRIGGAYWAIAYFKGNGFGPLHLADRLSHNLAELASQDGRPPREYHCKELWEVFFEPVLKSVISSSDVNKLERLVVVPCGELFSLPLHVAAVPTHWTGETEPRLLGQWRPLCFSISLASHVLRNRASFRSCLRQVDDDLFVLFAGEPHFLDEIKGVVAAAAAWPGRVLETAGVEAIRSVVEAKPEFFVLQCHGEILDDPTVGSVLRLHGGVLSNFGIATRQWLPRNKLTALGACVSGRPVRFGNDKGEISPAGEIAGFIRGFIAAGCGALLVTNWSVLQQELGAVTERIIKRIGESKSVIQLDSLLREILDFGNGSSDSIDARIERSIFQLYL